MLFISSYSDSCPTLIGIGAVDELTCTPYVAVAIEVNLAHSSQHVTS